MFGRKKKDCVFEDQALLKGPPRTLHIAKAAYSPSHAGAVPMGKDEQVTYIGPAPGTNSKDWTCIKNKNGQQGYVPTTFLEEKPGEPQLLPGHLRIAKTDMLFVAAHKNSALELKAPLSGVILCEQNKSVPDMVVNEKSLKTLQLQYNEKGAGKGEKRTIELLMTEASVAKVESTVPELIKALPDAPPSWQEKMEAKRAELKSAALRTAVAAYGATEKVKEELEKAGITGALKNFGVAEEYQEEVGPHEYTVGEWIQTLAGDRGEVVSSEYLPDRQNYMVKVKLESGRMRSYYSSDVSPLSQDVFGPEPCKIKSLSKSAATDSVSLQLEEGRLRVDAAAVKFCTDDGWTDATMQLKDLTKATIDTKGSFKYKDALGFDVELRPVLLETEIVSLQLLVPPNRAPLIIEAIEKGRVLAVKEARERAMARKATEDANENSAAAQPAEVSVASGSCGWDEASMKVPDGWPGAAATPAPASAGGDGWGNDSMKIPDGWPPVAAAALAPAPSLLGQSASTALLGATAAPNLLNSTEAPNLLMMSAAVNTCPAPSLLGDAAQPSLLDGAAPSPPPTLLGKVEPSSTPSLLGGVALAPSLLGTAGEAPSPSLLDGGMPTAAPLSEPVSLLGTTPAVPSLLSAAPAADLLSNGTANAAPVDLLSAPPVAVQAVDASLFAPEPETEA